MIFEHIRGILVSMFKKFNGIIEKSASSSVEAELLNNAADEEN
jgi:hypothetical protein